MIPTILSNIGSIKDKLAIFRLNLELKNKTIDAIFNEKQLSTLDYLKKKGFSNRIIQNFFRPFFSGIFLETQLRTSSAMFQFTYKMFGEGLAVIPKTGIQAIPNQLQSVLKKTTFKFNTKVKTVQGNQINLDNGIVMNSDVIVIATEASKLLGMEKSINWKSCDTLYFEVENKTIKKPIIGLLTNDAALINNFFFTTSIKNNNTTKVEVLSVTIVKEHHLSETELITQVKKELQQNCKIVTKRFIKRYHIKNALPDLEQVTNEGTTKHFQFSDHIYLAGDHQINGSLNAAMSSGALVAQLISDRFECKD